MKEKKSTRVKWPTRNHPAHHPPVESFNRSIIVLLSVCSKGRRPIFAHDDVHQVLLFAWTKAIRWRVGRYVVMPDHLHIFCAPACEPHEQLRTWMRYWKALASRKWPRPNEHPIWQQDGWDTQIRHGESYGEKWEYVRHNPVRMGLVSAAEDWPYQGELNVLEWHD